MDQQLTDIVVVLDRSGSMASVADDTIGGFNTFLQEQKDAEGHARLTLSQFDNEHELVHERLEIDAVPPLDESTFVPRGSTALLDAIGRTISSVRARLKSDSPEERPWKVVFVIITDGQENASREFTWAQVFEMIQRQQGDEGWEFLFLGANQDAIGEAGAIGIPMDKAAAWSKAGALHNIYSKKLAMFRAMRDANALKFDDADRKELDEDDDSGPDSASGLH